MKHLSALIILLLLSPQAVQANPIKDRAKATAEATKAAAKAAWKGTKATGKAMWWVPTHPVLASKATGRGALRFGKWYSTSGASGVGDAVTDGALWYGQVVRKR